MLAHIPATLPVGNPMKRLWQRISFTLVEMLAVVVIIGLLVVAGIPAFMRIATSGSVNSSLRQVSNALSLARQYAITQRTITRVVFPYSVTGTAYTNSEYISFAVVASNRTAIGTAPAGWNYIGKWEYLPMGSVFYYYLNTSAGSLNKLSSDSNVPYPTNGAAGGTLAYIEFQPTGAATVPPSLKLNYLIIQEGFVTSNVSGTPGENGPGVLTGGGHIGNNAGTITVDSMIGHISVTRK